MKEAQKHEELERLFNLIKEAVGQVMRESYMHNVNSQCVERSLSRTERIRLEHGAKAYRELMAKQSK